MIFNGLKKILTLSLVLTLFLNSNNLAAQDSGALDESLNDLYMVLGAGGAGAILGLSTLSFAKKPSDKVKNISIGGAIGIVIGVVLVLSTQTHKSHSSIGYAQLDDSQNSFNYESFERQEFTNDKVAKGFYEAPNFGVTFSF